MTLGIWINQVYCNPGNIRKSLEFGVVNICIVRLRKCYFASPQETLSKIMLYKRPVSELIHAIATFF